MANTFDPKKTSVIVDGKFITGFMDGTFIVSEKNEDNVIAHVGSQGDVTYTESADDTGMITLTLKQTSTSLPILQKLAKEKRSFAANVVDANDGKFKSGGTQCRILKTPSREFGSEVSGVEVQIHVSDYSAI